MNEPDPFTAAVSAADPRARRALALLRAMSEVETEAWFRCGQRIVQSEQPRPTEDSVRGGAGSERVT